MTDSTTSTAVFALGANTGDPLAALQGALSALARIGLLHDLQVSAVYETDPVGGPQQPVYLNAVLLARTAASPVELLGLGYRVEQQFGRTREVRWGPRTLDVDLIAVGQLRQDRPSLHLPHPRAHERGFVLVPWAQLDPDAVLVGHGRVGDLAAAARDREGADAVRVTERVLLVGQ